MAKMTEKGKIMNWRKARKSASNGACVEVAHTADGRICVRDSKDPSGPVLAFTMVEWAAFVVGVKNGEFDLGAFR